MSHVTFTENQIFCPLCQNNRKFLKVRSAATLIEVSSRTIYRYLDEGKVYSIKTPGGTSRVCSGCLMKSEPEDLAENFLRK